jgi:hypothetical protein
LIVKGVRPDGWTLAYMSEGGCRLRTAGIDPVVERLSGSPDVGQAGTARQDAARWRIEASAFALLDSQTCDVGNERVGFDRSRRATRAGRQDDVVPLFRVNALAVKKLVLLGKADVFVLVPTCQV